MFNLFRRRLKSNKGFTLVELIVVIAILGILATVAIPRLTGIQTSAKESVDTANLKMLNNAVEMYYAEKGIYPSDTDLPTFKTDLDKYLPAEGIPACKAGGSFYYDKDATGSKVSKTATATASDCVKLN